MFRKYGLLGLLVLSMAVFSCSKDSKNSTGTDNSQQPPALPQNLNVTVPTNATPEVQAYAATTNGYWILGHTYLTLIAAMQATQSGDTWTWTRTINNQGTVTAKAVKQNDGSYAWTVMVDGTFQDSTYNNWTVLTGTTSADAKSGNWTLYASNTATQVATYQWSVDEQNNMTSELLNLQENKKVDFVNNADGSGSLMVYQGDTLLFESSWDSTGAGTWKKYDTNGNLVDQGTWQKNP